MDKLTPPSALRGDEHDEDGSADDEFDVNSALSASQCPRDKIIAQTGPTRSQSKNSEVPSGDQFAKMNDILEKIWHCVDSRGKKRTREDQESSAESDPDEYTAKRRRPVVCKDVDRLSVTASEDDVRELLSSDEATQPDPKDSAKNTTDDDLLLELEQQFNEDESMGPAIGEKLANIAIKRWAEKLGPEKIKDIHGKYKQPSNCADMRISRVNPEIWSQISQHKKRTDLRLSKVQQSVQKAVFAALQIAENLTAKNRGLAPNDKKANEELLRVAVNMIAMLGHTNAELMAMRQESIKPALKPEFQKICHVVVPPNSKFLFGDDLAKLVRDSKETNNIASALTITKTVRRNNNLPSTSRRGSHTYSREEFYAGDNRGRNSNTKPFLWKGQKSFRRRPNNGFQNQQHAQSQKKQ